jgi:tetratricopeptide (TPR) repeat protein
MTQAPPTDVSIFLAAGKPFETALIALSAAESLTDDVAVDLLGAADVERADVLVRALHVCDFVVERNSEWNLAPRARAYLQEQLALRPPLFRAAHTRLLDVARGGAARDGLNEVPRYLLEGPGEAYHLAALRPEAGLPKYAELAITAAPGQQWLAIQLAGEQQAAGVLPTKSLEIDFLTGMVRYRERRIAEAERLLRSVAATAEDRIEVAIALHILGHLDGRGRPAQAEKELRQSLAIARRLPNARHEGQVLHTLGRLLGRSKRRKREAETLLRRSLRTRRDQNDGFGEMQVLHTLGHLLGRTRGREVEAEGLLRDSLRIGEALGDGFAQAQVLHTLGQLVGRTRGREVEAEGLLRDSLRTREELGDGFAQAQVLHTLGELVGRDAGRTAEAEQLLDRSLKLGEQLGNWRHQAQVLYTWGKLRARTDHDAGVSLLRRSLAIDQDHDDREGVRVVRAALQRLGADPEEDGGSPARRR